MPTPRFTFGGRTRTGSRAALIEQATPSLHCVATAGIDYLRGRHETRNQGIGIDEMPDIEAVVVTVDQENRPSWRALERSGYGRIWAGLLASDDPSDAGPQYLLVRWR